MPKRIATFYPKLVGPILALYWVALAWQAWRVGLTFDEPTHMIGAYLYWLNRPDMYPQDLPPLIKILTGWIPRVLEIPLFPELPSWSGWKQDISSDILERLSPAQIQELFYLMRLALTVFPVSLALLIWHWGRQVFGATAGFLLFLVAVLSPTTLAHGCLLKSDVATTFGYVLTAYCGWRFWREPGGRTALALGSSALLAVLAKMSMLVVVGLAAMLVLARAARGPRPVKLWLVPALGAVLLVPYFGLLAAYKFDARRLTAADIAEMREKEEFPEPLLAAAQIFRFIPTPIDVQTGVRSLSSYEKYGAPSYFLGEARSRGHWAYYLLALALKIPIAIQVLFAAGLIVALIRSRRERSLVDFGFLLAPGLIYLGFASESDLQLGVRLVLPAVPFLILTGGFAIERALETRPAQIALTILLAWLAGASAFIYPQGIAYFNEWAGGPANGAKYLVDSNLDWGQNLPELADYIRRNGVKKIKLYYFGFDKMHRYGVLDRMDFGAPPWNPKQVNFQKELKPQPGWYAVSATLLPGHFFGREYRDYFRCFREIQPVGRAGYSIFIYEIK